MIVYLYSTMEIDEKLVFYSKDYKLEIINNSGRKICENSKNNHSNLVDISIYQIGSKNTESGYSSGYARITINGHEIIRNAEDENVPIDIPVVGLYIGDSNIHIENDISRKKENRLELYRYYYDNQFVILFKQGIILSKKVIITNQSYIPSSDPENNFRYKTKHPNTLLPKDNIDDGDWEYKYTELTSRGWIVKNFEEIELLRKKYKIL